MAAAPGTRFGAYEVLAPLGAGGMGEVYRARDTKLGREIALKILPATFAEDADRIARFEREAKILASLNHPGIAQVYGFEDAPAAASEKRTCALVMELVEGEDLSLRLLRGPLSTDEALAVALQIADALDTAHEAGIVHRDLKPANIKVREDGTIKVLDFGLAKPGAASAAREADAVNSPTITSPATLTMHGMILGTAAYMSPEQAKGKPVDKRADIWAFGCVLDEMLTGRRAFEGEDVAETLARVLDREPDWTRLPNEVPEQVRATIARCLTKAPRARMRDIGDVRHALEQPGGAVRPAVPARASAAAWLGWGTAAVTTAVVIGLLVTRRETAAPSPPIIRTSIELPAGYTLSPRDRSYPIAISPDGARLAFVAEIEGRSELFVREFDSLTATPLAGTAGARQPFFSPDGRWIGFFAGQTLQRVAVDGGAPIRISDVATGTAGGTWGANDTIVFAAAGEGLFSVGAGGGAPQRIDETDPAAWPDFLPDGRTILYSTGEQFPSSAIATIGLDGGRRRILARITTAAFDAPASLGTVEIAQARFLSSGHIVYGQSPGAIRRVPFDPATLTIAGSPISIADSIERGAGSGAVYFAASQTDVLIYVPTGERHQLVWVDRQGVETPISSDRAAFRIPHLSPDGRRIAVSINDEARRSDIWVYDAERGTRERLTTAEHNLESVWTPDGKEVWFTGSSGINAVPVDQPGARRLEVQTRGAFPNSWTPDGQQLLYHVNDDSSRNVMIRNRGGTPRPLLDRPFNEWMATVSLDGRWLAYSSDESGRFEIYVTRFPDLSGRVAVSSEGGVHPIWSRDSRELFYRAGNAVMAVAIDTAKGFQAGRPQRLFSGAYTGTAQDYAFDVALDGRRFVMVKSDEASTRRRITVVQNWNNAPASR